MERSSRRLAVLTALLAMGRMQVMAGAHVGGQVAANKPAGTMAERFAAIRGEYEAAARKAEAEAEKGKTGGREPEDLLRAAPRRGGSSRGGWSIWPRPTPGTQQPATSCSG